MISLAACLVQAHILLRLNPEIGATYHYACEFKMTWKEPDGTRRLDRWITRLKLTSKRKGRMTMQAQTLAQNDSAKKGFLGTGSNDTGPFDFLADADGLFNVGPVGIMDGLPAIYNCLALATVAPTCGFAQSSIEPGAHWDLQREGFFSALPQKLAALTVRSTYLGVLDRKGVRTAEMSTVLTSSPSFRLTSSFLLQSGMCYRSQLEAGELTGMASLVYITHSDGTRSSFTK